MIVRLRVIAIVIASISSPFQGIGAFTSFPSQFNDACRSFRSSQKHNLVWSSRVDLQFRAILDNQEHKQFWTLPRLYVGERHNMRSKRALSTGALVTLSPDQSHYLIKVMRLFKNSKANRRQPSEGDNEARIRIFNGQDGEWLAKVHVSSRQEDDSSSSGKHRSKNDRSGIDSSLIAECITRLREQDCSEDDRPWVLFVPLKKQPRMKFIVEKCTELGVGKLIPVSSDRMEGDAFALLGPRDDDKVKIYHDANDGKLRLDKLQLHSIEASEQCERLGIPMITCDLGLTISDKSRGEIVKVRDLVEKWCQAWEMPSVTTHSNTRRVLLICRERGSGEDTVPVLQAVKDKKLVSFLVGPEGGWSAQEEEMFDEICSRFAGRDESPIQCVSLGSSVLRAETACMMAVGAWALMEKS